MMFLCYVRLSRALKTLRIVSLGGIFKLLIVVALSGIPAFAQQPSTRWGITTAVGTESGLGYALPYTAFGAGIEKAFGDRVELQADADFSPTRKLVTKDGRQFHVTARALYWIGSRVALVGGDGEAALWTNEFAKRSNNPFIGMGCRLWWMGIPSRLYLSYLIPTGSRPTDGSLQSNRTQGVSFTYQGQGWTRARLSSTLNVLTLVDQSGAAPGVRHWTGTVVMTLRFGTKQNIEELY